LQIYNFSPTFLCEPVYVPRTPTGANVGTSARAVYFWGTSNNAWNELQVVDGASLVGFDIVIHMQNLYSLGVGKYLLFDSNFQNRSDSIAFNHIYFKIWDSNINNYAYYGSVKNKGEINLTRNSNDIYSGNFSGEFVRQDDSNDIIKITDGRFDIGPGITTKVFP
jgi:hypothetical protein